MNRIVKLGERDGKTVFKVYGYCMVAHEIEVPFFYECDGASVPALLKPIFGDLCEYKYYDPAVVHDFMYEYGVECRKVADRIYVDWLISLGYNKFKAWFVYIGIRLFGAKHYRSTK